MDQERQPNDSPPKSDNQEKQPSDPKASPPKRDDEVVFKKPYDSPPKGSPKGKGSPNGTGSPKGKGSPNGNGARKGKGSPKGKGSHKSKGSPKGKKSPRGSPKGKASPRGYPKGKASTRASPKGSPPKGSPTEGSPPERSPPKAPFDETLQSDVKRLVAARRARDLMVQAKDDEPQPGCSKESQPGCSKDLKRSASDEGPPAKKPTTGGKEDDYIIEDGIRMRKAQAVMRLIFKEQTPEEIKAKMDYVHKTMGRGRIMVDGKPHTYAQIMELQKQWTEDARKYKDKDYLKNKDLAIRSKLTPEEDKKREEAKARFLAKGREIIRKSKMKKALRRTREEMKKRADKTDTNA